MAVGDGALGLWSALGQVFPTTEHQRCWNHRALNVQSKLPKRLQGEARRRLREMAESETLDLCEQRRNDYVAELRGLGQERAAETVLRDKTSSPSTTILRSTGCTCEPAFRLSPSLAG